MFTSWKIHILKPKLGGGWFRFDFLGEPAVNFLWRKGWPFGCVKKNVRPQEHTQVSIFQNPYDIPLYWLFNKDPYNGLF